MIQAGQYLLRPFESTDAAEMSAAVRASVDTVGRWMSWAKADCNTYDAACWFDACIQARANGSAHEFGIFAADGAYVGGCGLNQFSRINKRCNLGYWVRQSRQGEGAATAATRAMQELGLQRLGLARVEIVIAESNAARIAVARKSGAHFECLARNRLQIHGKPTAAHVFSFTSDTAA